MKVYIILAGLCSLAKYTAGLECNQCLSSPTQEACTTKVTCQPDQNCYVERYGSGPTTGFNMFCKSKELCSQGSAVGRDLAKRDVCTQCCDTDGCNQYACAPPVPISTVPGQIACDTSNGYQLFMDSAVVGQLCVKIHSSESKSWEEARLTCQAEGGDLVVLDSSAKSILMKHQVFTERHTGYWIGAKDFASNDVFVWVNQKPVHLDLGDWASSQPNHNDGGHIQDCACMWGSDDYEWHDDYCAKALNFICERS